MSEFHIWKKGEKIQLSKNFNSSEFSCRCSHKECVDQKISTVLVEKLQALRNLYGPIMINSAYRCEAHNKRVGGVKGSQHTKGTACDIKPAGGRLAINGVAELNRLKEEVDTLDFGGVGFYKKQMFIHVDVRNKKARW